MKSFMFSSMGTCSYFPIGVATCIGHGILLMLICMLYDMTPSKPPMRQPVAIRTFTAPLLDSPSLQDIPVMQTQSVQQNTLVATAEEPVSKQETSKSVAKEEPAPKPKEAKASQKKAVKPALKASEQVKPVQKKDEKAKVKKAEEVSKAAKEIRTEASREPSKASTAAAKRRAELLAQAKESMQKLKQVQGPVAEAMSKVPDIKESKISAVPGSISNATGNEGFLTEATPEDLYEQELGMILKLMLQLPEPGEVNIALTLSRDGKIKSVTNENSGSLRNNNYVKDNIKKVAFTAFGKCYIGESAHTFTIKLRTGML